MVMMMMMMMMMMTDSANDQGSFSFALKKPECVAETNVNGFHYLF